MDEISLVLMAGLGVVAAIYTHYRLPFLTVTRTQAGWARAILMLTGVAFGWVAVQQIGRNESGLIQMLIFVAAWGLVHIPAAIILFLKQQQRKG